MNEDKEFTSIRIRKGTLNIIRRYAGIHNLSFPRLMDNLATLLTCGIDGLTEWDLPTLQKHYHYSGILVMQDTRNYFKPKGEQNE